MNSAIMRIVEVTDEYQPLSAVPLVGSFDLSAAPDNEGAVYFLGDDGSDVPWVAGEYHHLRSVDLARLQIKGTPGDHVSIIGGTW